MRSETMRRVLCLCVVVLGIAGLGASLAQAEPHWNVGGAEMASGLLPTIKIKKNWTLHFKIGGNSVLLLCSAVVAVQGHLVWRKLVLFSLKGTGCSIDINAVKTAACEPNNNGTEPGVVVSNTLLGELKEHSTGEGVLPVKSTVEETVAGVKQPVFGRIKMSAECSIGSNVPIIGPQVAIVDSGGMTGLLTESKVHSVKEFAALTEFWALSKTAEHKGTSSGEAEVELESGANWSGKL